MDGSALPEIRSTCAYCGVGCGVLLRPDGEGGLSVRGDPDHPANFGRLCSKGSALGETVGLDHRLLEPKLFGFDASWDEALQTVADRFSQTIAEHGPHSVAFYVSGQLLTEDYYVANKLMKGFIGSANIDTNSRLCMASSVAGHKRAFGTDTVPGTYEDLEEADLIVLVGSNLAWCHPVLYQRVIAAREKRGTKIVVVDPRRTASCDQAEIHLPLAPGSDVALFNHLLTQIADRDLVDSDFLENTNGFEAAIETARASDLDICGLSAEDVQAFCDLWIGTEKVVTIYSQGVNQSTSGADKVNSILNCHLATGRIGREGMGPFSVTGQPNAMGGREVGGLANMLACHLDLENADHRDCVQTFWNAPTIPDAPGKKAVDMFKAVAEGQIKALWVIHTNPAVSMPDADFVRDAIAKCPFTVVSEVTAESDTARLADVLLPAAAWAEKTGTVTNSDRTISRQRAVIPTPGNARADWDILAEVGQRMGWKDAFDYASAADVFREYAALSAETAKFGKDFDISGLVDIDDAAYDALPPTRWPISNKRSGGRFFADGQFFHADKKAKFIPVTHRPPVAKTEPRLPFRLNTGRIRDQWHTMTRSALSPRLSSHLAEPFLDINPNDAEKIGVAAADLIEVNNPSGRAILRARITDDVPVGQVFAPIHWTGETAPSARIDALVPGEVDPVSGQPELKAAVAAARKFDAGWYGFAMSVKPFTPQADYWALARTAKGYRAELAGISSIEDWEAMARTWFGLPNAEAMMMQDASRGSYRMAFVEDGKLLAAIFISKSPVALSRDYLVTRLGEAATHILSGATPPDVEDTGTTVCSCFGVGSKTIQRAIEKQGLSTVDEIGACLQAGTNCGSCKPELAQFLELYGDKVPRLVSAAE